MKKDWMIKESELDDDQLKVLMATNNKSLVVAGCAGSGKSVLALIKAQRIQKEKGNDYQIIVYTKALCNFMNSGRQELGLEKSFTYYWDWKNRKGCQSSDYVIVDEIQDFNEKEIKEFINATRKEFFFFGDTAQSIYDGFPNKGETVAVDDIPYLTEQYQRPRVRELYRNYRLPLSVAKLVHSVGVDLAPFDANTYRSEEKEVPRILQSEEQVKTIETLIKDKSDIAILLPHNVAVKKLSKQMDEQSFKHEVRYNDEEDWRQSKDTLNFSSSLPKLMTYHSAKGLQFETVILPFLEEYQENRIRDRKALYVAMTRTYKELFVLYSGSMPSVLSMIPDDLYKTTIMDEIEDI